MVKLEKQRGIVLVISIIFLVALTSISSMLMRNSIIDIKTTSANQEKMLAVEKAISVVDEVIAQQVSQISGNNNFTHDEITYPYTLDLNDPQVQANISLVNNNSYNVNCPHSELPSSIKTIRCHNFLINVSHQYGRHNSHAIIVKSGVSQQIIHQGN